MHLIRAALTFREKSQDLFRAGEFIPAEARGRYERNIVAFLRRTENSLALVVVPRWFSQVCGPEGSPGTPDWSDTRIIVPDGSPHEWNDVVTGTKVEAKTEGSQTVLMANDLFMHFPVALCHVS